MGGGITVESVLGEGACFRVRLPAIPAEQTERLGAGARGPDVAGARVCVVDDNPANREVAQRMLEACGVEVSTAESGAGALERLALLPVDVVFMDLRMPGMDGLAALAALRRADGPNANVPVLAFTADADIGASGELDGFDGLVRKPIELVNMLSAIAAAMDWSPAADAAGAAA
jgi:CheY-like chemotaxis protein